MSMPGNDSYFELTLHKESKIDVSEDHHDLTGSINKDIQGSKDFLDHLHHHLDMEKQELEHDLEQTYQDFNRERFYTLA